MSEVQSEASGRTEAQSLVVRLIQEANMSPVEISSALGGRVSSRTIYRWSKGESYPQNSSDFDALRQLVGHRLPA